MKFTSQAATVETFDIAESTDFSIKVTGKAFKILLDGLYSDKVGAVIRELSTNAYDAHLAIGKGETPFEVELPTMFNPIFRVRDFGVSMTHEQLMRMMATLFESSKDTSNNQVGAFGLGSKSPFSMVDTYSITAWKDGEKRNYSAYFNTDGVPALALLGREASTDAPGVEFSMTVNPKDVYAFSQKAVRVLQWFPTPPKILHNAVVLPKHEVLVEGKGWKLFKPNLPTGQYPITGAAARQGCVVYPLSGEAIGTLTSAQRAILSSPLLLDFPIGSLDVAASRESLSYDAKTSSNIAARLNLVLTEITEHFGKSIRDAPTKWAAGRARFDLISARSLPSELVDVVAASKWQNKHTVENSFTFGSVTKALQAKGIECKSYFWDSSRVYRSSKSLSVDEAARHYYSRAEWQYGRENITLFFALDTDRPLHEGRRMRDKCGSSAVFYVVTDKAHQQEILDAWGNPPDSMVHWVADISVPPTSPRAFPVPKRGTTKKEEVKVYELEIANNARVFKPEKVVPLDGKAFYLFTRGGDAIEMGVTKTRSYTIGELIRPILRVRTEKMLDETTPIYLISTTYQKRIEAFKDWTHLSAEVMSKTVGLEDRLKNEDEETSAIHRLSNSTWAENLRANNSYRTMVQRIKTGPLYDLYETIVKHGYSTGKSNLTAPPFGSYYDLCCFGLDTDAIGKAITAHTAASVKIKEIDAAIQRCTNAYPMAAEPRNRYSYSGSTGHSASDLVEYVEALDTLRAARVAAIKPVISHSTVTQVPVAVAA